MSQDQGKVQAKNRVDCNTTIVMIESKPSESGSLVMKSMLMTSKGIAFGVTVMGLSGAFGMFVRGLVL